MVKLTVVSTLTLLCAIALPHAASAAPIDPADDDAIAAVVHDACHREVVMLGESNTHGDGNTEAFKVAIVERLISECGFDSVIFEANHAEFINIARRFRTNQPVSVDQVSAAIGGLWKFDREFQPLVPFLLAKAQARQISLGGIDDQLGGLEQDYANVEMFKELTGLLPPQQRQDCTLALHRRIYSDYTKAAPYSQSDRSQIAACLSDIQLAVTTDRTSDRRIREEWREMISATQRWVNRDFVSTAESDVSRDRSMFQNFQWLRRQQPRRHKVIVWAATVHIAKQGGAKWADRSGTNFGSYVHREYGARAYSLGFSALSGAYRQGRSFVHDLPSAPPDSAEALAIHGTEASAVYLGLRQLAAMGTLPGAIFGHSYQTLRWANFLDGVVVFRAEHPPSSTPGT
jgi:erythromycin esterase-like protein